MLDINALLGGLQDVVAVRKFFRSKKTIDLLYSMGIEIRVFELHAPSVSAKKSYGLGQTLCGRKNRMRHSQITCKKCLKARKRLEYEAPVKE